MKLYEKLGLSSRYLTTANGVKDMTNDDFEKFGAAKFSFFHDMGVSKEQDLIGVRYERFYSDAQAKNTNNLVNGFKNREFINLNEYLQSNEKLRNSYFQTVI